MSLKANSTAKTKLLSSAVFLALVGTSTSGYAVNFGATSYQSAQHEPLSASIPVSDIDANNFDVSLANSAIYQQMGLTPNASIRASFQRTSANSGRIILSSSKPINDPFADIVLDIKSNDKKQFMPKTLLMPMGNNSQANTAPVIASSSKVNLPKVNQQPKANLPKPQAPKLPVATQAQSNTQVQPAVTQPADASKGIPDGEFAEATRQAFIADQAANKKLEEAKKSQGTSEAMTAKQAEKPKAAVTSTNAQQSNKAQTTATQPVVTAAAKPKISTAPTQEPAIGKVPSDRILLQDKASLQAESTKKPAVKPTPAKKPQPAAKQASGKSTYVVQRNDNLWTIAYEIAKRNKANVHTVMKQIQSNNPNAFINGNASRLITNKTLVLPDYETVPSQKSLEEAIAARRAAVSKRYASTAKARSSSRSNQQAKTTRNKARNNNTTAKAKPSSSRSTSKYTAPPKPATRAASKPKPRVSLVAPGSSSKSNSKRATGSSTNSKLVTTLRSSRQTTARHASRVRQLNTQVSSYTQRLQLQNKKLAELEARLKQLRGK